MIERIAEDNEPVPVGRRFVFGDVVQVSVHVDFGSYYDEGRERWQRITDLCVGSVLTRPDDSGRMPYRSIQILPHAPLEREESYASEFSPFSVQDDPITKQTAEGKILKLRYSLELVAGIEEDTDRRS